MGKSNQLYMAIFNSYVKLPEDRLQDVTRMTWDQTAWLSELKT